MLIYKEKGENLELLAIFLSSYSVCKVMKILIRIS